MPLELMYKIKAVNEATLPWKGSSSWIQLEVLPLNSFFQLFRNIFGQDPLLHSKKKKKKQHSLHLRVERTETPLLRCNILSSLNHHHVVVCTHNPLHTGQKIQSTCKETQHQDLLTLH